MRSLHNSRRREEPITAFGVRVELEHHALDRSLGSLGRHKLLGREKGGRIAGDPLVDVRGCEYLLGRHLLPAPPLLLLLVAHRLRNREQRAEKKEIFFSFLELDIGLSLPADITERERARGFVY